MMKILIIEDDALIQKTIELKLKKEGYEVICANDGKEGLEKLQMEIPDVVLTDLMLPFSSGLEIVTAVKAISGIKIKVIVLSSMGQEHVVEEAFNLGADDYITKPFSLNELTLRIKRIAKTS